MEAPSTVVVPLGRAAARHGILTPFPWAAFALTGLLWFVALAVTLRRAGGAVHEPLGTAALFGTGLMAAAIAVAIRALVRLEPRGHHARMPNAMLLPLPSLAVIVLGFAIWLPDTSLLDGLLFWVAPVVAETVLWRRALRGRSLVPQRPTGSSRPTENVEKRIANVSEQEPSDEVQHQLVRRRSIDGTEMIEGWVRATLMAGQRTAWAHVAFCPPFGTMPQLSVTQQSGPRARVSVGRLLPYGARFDLKLAAASDEETTVLLSFTVSCRTSHAKTAG